MGVFNVIGAVFSKLFSVITMLVPLLDVIKQLIPSLRDEAEFLENLVARGEEEADAAIDRSRNELIVIREWFTRLRLGATGMESTIDQLLAAAEDDAVTVPEIEAVVATLQDAIQHIIAVGESSDEMVKALEKVKNA